MKVPTYDVFIEPLLRFLAAQPGSVSPKDVYAALARELSLTAEQQAAMLPSGFQPIFKNRIGWANDRLKRAGYSQSPRRGQWEITGSGRKLANETMKLSDDQIRALAKPGADSRASSSGLDNVDEGLTSSAAPLSPEERIELGLHEARVSVARDILAAISRNSPSFFEALVLDLLLAMGYGQSREALQQVGRSGDGGIDGIVSLDRLGLEKIYVQAKRWQGQVGSPEVQIFIGALQLRDASKGVLITSGSLSEPAKKSAEKSRNKVVLIDGERLASLMIDYKVGVLSQEKIIPRIDSDYFDRE